MVKIKSVTQAEQRIQKLLGLNEANWASWSLPTSFQDGDALQGMLPKLQSKSENKSYLRINTSHLRLGLMRLLINAITILLLFGDILRQVEFTWIR